MDGSEGTGYLSLCQYPASLNTQCVQWQRRIRVLGLREEPESTSNLTVSFPDEEAGVLLFVPRTEVENQPEVQGTGFLVFA